MTEADFEKLGVFYLGRQYDLNKQELTRELCLYESKDLLTHAVCIGMTGSGKTGLCLDLIEEAAIDGIPVIAIDPKGDIGNLLLTFPDLSAEEFQPWVEASEAQKAGMDVQAFASLKAKQWQEGLAQWDESKERVTRLRDSANFSIYTPGSSAGIGISIVNSFEMPPQAVIDDPDSFLEKVSAAASSLLSLLAIDADPLQSREHILLSNILQTNWQSGKNLSLSDLIAQVQNPLFSQIGAMDLESVYPAKKRLELAMRINNLLASPGFNAWKQGVPLDVSRLLYSEEGKPQVAVVSIAHLSDNERMFFVALLLNQVLAWIRTQPGTSSLRAILYMDEIFGYFPPTANPPSKTPLLTLMKQARAFGLGVVLATQNPVDIDYKGLANAGTWFIGRLQTERDKMRVLDGLEGAAGNSGSVFDRQFFDKALSKLAPRTFLMNNVHDTEPTVLMTRWTLSYLKGPLTREEIKRLMAPTKAGSAKTALPSKSVSSDGPAAAEVTPATEAATVQIDARTNYFLPVRLPITKDSHLRYKAHIIGIGNVNFSDAQSNTNTTLQYSLLYRGENAEVDWSDAQPSKVWLEQLGTAPEKDSTVEALPSYLSNAKQVSDWSKDFVGFLYQTKEIKIFKNKLTGQYSRPRESERDFRIRLSQIAREKRDEAIEQLKTRYGPKLTQLSDRLHKAELQLHEREQMVQDQQLQAALSVGATVLGAFMGRKRISNATIGRATTAARKVGQTTRRQQQAETASQTVENISQQLDDLNQQFATEVAALEGKFDPQAMSLDEITVKPKKANVKVELLAVVFAPYLVMPDKTLRPAWLPAEAPNPA